jgi:hypothetical protein
MKFKILIITISFTFLSGCFSQGSKGWFISKNDAEIDSYYDTLPVPDLCYNWDKRWDAPKMRQHMSASLKRRGMSPYLCHNPQSDQINELRSEVEKLKSRPTYSKPTYTDKLIDKMQRGEVY